MEKRRNLTRQSAFAFTAFWNDAASFDADSCSF